MLLALAAADGDRRLASLLLVRVQPLYLPDVFGSQLSLHHGKLAAILLLVPLL